jgi:transaldolase
VANARLAYEIFQHRFATERWQALAARGARVQRPLWASTSTKDPAYPDTMYVDDLIAPDTVNTMPEATLHATADHGTIEPDTITGHYDEARAVIADLEALGIGYDDVVRVLEEEGVRKFADSWDDVKRAIGGQLDAAHAAHAASR